MNCIFCLSENVRRNGGRFNASKGIKSRWKCVDCHGTFTTLEEAKTKIITKKSPRTIVITSAINNTGTHQDFFDSLINYCDHNDADLYVIPTRHKNIDESYVGDFDITVKPYLLKSNLNFPEYKFKIFGSLKLSASMTNPLSGLDPMSKGDTLVVGHPQVQLKTLPRVYDKYPPILTTTGSVSTEPYSDTKPGIKASFNHSFSALVVEFDSNKTDKFVHIRHLNYDESSNGFYDLDYLYTPSDVTKTNKATVLVTGDEHAIHSDKDVKEATYLGKKSLCGLLNFNMVVRHDVLDCYSISHHDRNNFLNSYKKLVENKNILEKELDETVDYLLETKGNYENYIVQSNHNEHLVRWLNECDPKLEPWNAKIYHKLMYEFLDTIEKHSTYDPFESYSRERLPESEFLFVGRKEEFKVFDILLSAHGDVGVNGARGSRQQFSILPEKTIIGHSHSPGIEKGCYQVGTSSKLSLDYNVGPSSWHHCHCIIYPNGKRQLIFITNGKFRK